MARLIETDSLSNQNISAATAIGAYTSTATRFVYVRVAVDQAAGNGDYVIYATLQIGGAGSAYRIIPITTAAAASGVTELMFVSLGIPMDNTDVLTIYIDGLAGDTTTPDTRVDFYEYDYLRSTVAIPDDYSDDGTQPTILQAILEIHQYLMERSVSSTTVTVKKPNGSTAAMIFTLDDATNPTSITRAT